MIDLHIESLTIPLGFPSAPGLAKRGREFQLVTVLVVNAAADAQIRHMRVHLHAVLVPHGELLLRIPAAWLPRGRVPGPNLERIEQVQIPHQFAGLQLDQAANKVSIDVVGVVFVFGKRAIGEHLADACLPELPRESLKVADQFFPPRPVP
jgi:hypothetical protein